MTKKPQQVVELVADDNGYASHKIARFNEQGQIVCTKFDTSIQIGGSTLTSVDGNKEDTYEVLGEEGVVSNTYTCSSAITQPLDLRNSNYPFVEANRVLMQHSLLRSGMEGKQVLIAVTLPFADYFTVGGQMNVDIQERSQANFIQNNVVAEHGKAQVKIVGARVFPEGMCAFYDWALDESCNQTPGFEELSDNDGSALIVDIGGSTTDIVCIRMVDGNIKIDHAHSGTTKIGVLDVREEINKAYQKRFSTGGYESALSARALARIMETGTHKAGGQVHDLKADLEAIFRAVTQRVVSYMQSKAGRMNDFEVIHFVGGGAVLFGESLKMAVPVSSIGDEFANARGAIKYMKAQQAVA